MSLEFQAFLTSVVPCLGGALCDTLNAIEVAVFYHMLESYVIPSAFFASDETEIRTPHQLNSSRVETAILQFFASLGFMTDRP